ncbi:MAG: DUF86 domain-containing protein [Cytophagaceae bacterium]|nr:DUF86 domain-containing protein [Cytophagaceae bacterium]
MSKQNRQFKLFLEDMLEAMNRFAEYLRGMTFEDFVQNRMAVDAVVRNLEIIGEAAKNIPASVRQNSLQIPWDKMYRLRNIVTHEYFSVDHALIWDISANYLPHNRADLEILLETLRANPLDLS